MRIGARLLLTYFAIIGVVAVVAVFWVPRLVENSVRNAERTHLEQQAQQLADRFAERIRKDGSPDAAAAISRGLGGLENVMAEETIAIVGPNCRVLKSSNPALAGNVVSEICPAGQAPPTPQRLKAARRAVTLNLAGIGQVPVWATAPLAPDMPALRGFQVLVFRDLPFIKRMTAPIAIGLEIAIVLGFFAALVIAGWVSREMVKRLRDVGSAAAAVAEGDLTRRAPEAGKDEITELACHFNQMAERIQALVDGLRRSEQARRDLLMMVGHDLRTPMTSIAGFAEALKDGVVQSDEKKHRYYEIIHNEATRLTRLVNDLFDVAKLESGQMELRLQAMPVGPLLTEFAESMKPNAESLGSRIELEIAPEAAQARVYCDRDRLHQVLGNLTGNALRFSPEGAPVTLRGTVEGDFVRIEVADRGPGLTPEESERVFQRFYQGPNQGGSHKGAGLGLAIVKSLVEAHGGQVGVTSAPGQGATFWFKLNKVA